MVDAVKLEGLRPTRFRTVATLALLACAAVPFARVLFAGHVLYARDVHFVRWGELDAFARCIASGSWPVWDSLFGFGKPMLASPANQVLYPFTWLALVLSPPDYYDLYAFAHVARGWRSPAAREEDGCLASRQPPCRRRLPPFGARTLKCRSVPARRRRCLDAVDPCGG